MEPVENLTSSDEQIALEDEAILEGALLAIIQIVVIDEFMWDTINEMNE